MYYNVSIANISIIFETAKKKEEKYKKIAVAMYEIAVAG